MAGVGYALARKRRNEILGSTTIAEFGVGFFQGMIVRCYDQAGISNLGRSRTLGDGLILRAAGTVTMRVQVRHTTKDDTGTARRYLSGVTGPGIWGFTCTRSLKIPQALANEYEFQLKMLHHSRLRSNNAIPNV
jgi:hypothetical protein